MQKTDWAAAAVRVGNAVLAANAALLVFVEGLSYSTDLHQVAQHPIALAVANRLVYSPHDYSWSQTAVSYNDLRNKLDAAWGFIVASNASASIAAPLWLGEFGTDSSSSWWSWIRQYVLERELSWSYWALDGEQRPGVEETFGIFEKDYTTIRHLWKLTDLQAMQ